MARYFQVLHVLRNYDLAGKEVPAMFELRGEIVVSTVVRQANNYLVYYERTIPDSDLESQTYIIECHDIPFTASDDLMDQWLYDEVLPSAFKHLTVRLATPTEDENDPPEDNPGGGAVMPLRITKNLLRGFWVTY